MQYLNCTARKNYLLAKNVFHYSKETQRGNSYTHFEIVTHFGHTVRTSKFLYSQNTPAKHIGSTHTVLHRHHYTVLRNASKTANSAWVRAKITSAVGICNCKIRHSQRGTTRGTDVWCGKKHPKGTQKPRKVWWNGTVPFPTGMHRERAAVGTCAHTHTDRWTPTRDTGKHKQDQSKQSGNKEQEARPSSEQPQHTVSASRPAPQDKHKGLTRWSYM